ncbi:hypothetical protein PR048_013675 [Dryococelus australis]|uniref:Uncharacterized protein n=1 Tax=Dryococelus australis TaxID=614101 RepID=A0ABQ9HSU3_9NEOP|nr:hypothetical protein PR048_013675 [Dryococelus australis]
MDNLQGQLNERFVNHKSLISVFPKQYPEKSFDSRASIATSFHTYDIDKKGLYIGNERMSVLALLSVHEEYHHSPAT